MKKKFIENYDYKRIFLENIKDIKEYNPLFKDIIYVITSMQTKDGSFSLLNGQMPYDIRNYYNNQSSYICTSLYIKAFLYDDEWFIENIGIEKLKSALDFCSKTNFSGHGYEDLKVQIETIKLFIQNGLKQFMNCCYDINYCFSKMIENIIEKYKTMILNNNYQYFYDNYENEIKEVVRLYEN